MTYSKKTVNLPDRHLRRRAQPRAGRLGRAHRPPRHRAVLRPLRRRHLHSPRTG